MRGPVTSQLLSSHNSAFGLSYSAVWERQHTNWIQVETASKSLSIIHAQHVKSFIPFHTVRWRIYTTFETRSALIRAGRYRWRTSNASSRLFKALRVIHDHSTMFRIKYWILNLLTVPLLHYWCQQQAERHKYVQSAPTWNKYWLRRHNFHGFRLLWIQKLKIESSCKHLRTTCYSSWDLQKWSYQCPDLYTHPWRIFSGPICLVSRFVNRNVNKCTMLRF